VTGEIEKVDKPMINCHINLQQQAAASATTGDLKNYQ